MKIREVENYLADHDYVFRDSQWKAIVARAKLGKTTKLDRAIIAKRLMKYFGVPLQVQVEIHKQVIQLARKTYLQLRRSMQKNGPQNT